MACLKEWINASLSAEKTRVSIADFEEDFKVSLRSLMRNYKQFRKDGMVFKFLLEKHLKREISTPCGDFVQSKERQLRNVDHIIKVIR